ncbi:hypothetical protein [Psychrobacillus psychrodurans]
MDRSGGLGYKMETEWANALKEAPPRKVSVKSRTYLSRNVCESRLI